MNTFVSQVADIGGIATMVRTAGDAARPNILLLHGGTPGVSVYVGGSYLWGSTLDALAAKYRLVAPDLLACGATGLGAGALTAERMVAHALSILEATCDGQVHVVGHDLGALIGLGCAIDRPDRVASLTVVSSQAAAPTGDTIANLSLMSPPEPAWSRTTQAWAFDRLSYSHHHIDAALLDAAQAAVMATGHREVMQRQDEDAGFLRELQGSQMRVKFRFFKAAREGGIRVPVQVVCGSNDPLVSVDQNVWLFRAIAAQQKATQLQVINRAGNFPFREQPEQFRYVVDSFVTGVRDGSHVALT